MRTRGTLGATGDADGARRVRTSVRRALSFATDFIFQIMPGFAYCLGLKIERREQGGRQRRRRRHPPGAARDDPGLRRRHRQAGRPLPAQGV